MSGRLAGASEAGGRQQFCAVEVEVEVRSMMSYSMVIGSYFVAVEHGDRTRSQVLQLAIDHLLR